MVGAAAMRFSPALRSRTGGMTRRLVPLVLLLAAPARTSMYMHPWHNHQNCRPSLVSAAHRSGIGAASCQELIESAEPDMQTLPEEMEEILAGPQVVTSPFTKRIAGSFAILVVAFATAFSVLERWKPIDALLFTTTHLATIGFGDLRPARPISRALTALLGICGVGLLGGLVSAVIGEVTARNARLFHDFDFDEFVAMLPAATRAKYTTEDLREWFDSADLDGNGVLSIRELLAAARRRSDRLLLAGVSSRLFRLFRPANSAWLQLALLLFGGTVGVKLFEWRKSWLDALYMIVGIITTAGIGDVVPTTAASKLFIALYSPLAVVASARVLGTLAMRPLETVRRAAQRQVLERYSGTLTVEKLRELTAGPLVKRLGLSADDASCSMDEYTLLTLVLQGKVGENDLEECRAAFRELVETGADRLSIEDLELAKQRKMMRLEPRLRRRQITRVKKGLRRALSVLGPGPPLTDSLAALQELPVRDRMEVLFPQWRQGRGSGGEQGYDEPSDAQPGSQDRPDEAAPR